MFLFLGKKWKWKERLESEVLSLWINAERYSMEGTHKNLQFHPRCPFFKNQSTVILAPSAKDVSVLYPKSFSALEIS